jgi:hypothetical protein
MQCAAIGCQVDAGDHLALCRDHFDGLPNGLRKRLAAARRSDDLERWRVVLAEAILRIHAAETSGLRSANA